MSVPRGQSRRQRTASDAETGPAASSEIPTPRLVARFREGKGRTLLVGDGDLSFALALATAQGSGAGLVATTYDTEDEVRRQYDPWVQRTLKDLARRGVRVLHAVDARALHEPETLTQLKGGDGLLAEGFDQVVWNHPHSGFPAEHAGDHRGPGFEQQAEVTGRHSDLVQAFLRSVARPALLRPLGEIHITHKSTPPFSNWNLPALGEAEGLELLDASPFPAAAFPEFTCRRGAGRRPARMFPMQDSFTYVFRRPPPGPSAPPSTSPEAEAASTEEPTTEELTTSTATPTAVGTLAEGEPLPPAQHPELPDQHAAPPNDPSSSADPNDAAAKRRKVD